MPSFSNSAIFATSLIASASAAFSPSAKTNVVTYWGQGPNQQRLVETCKNIAVDVVNIGFVNQFPDQTGNDYPGDNFGNACYGDVYQLPNGQNSSLLKTCPNIGPDVITCQQTYGKKIFLSIGGGYPTNYYLMNDTSGRNFADFLWNAWGPVQSGYTGPRPWGNAVVDGFDFDIESYISPAPAGNANYQTSGYAAMINHLHNDLYPTDTSKSYYISGAPQCVLPDSHFTNVMNSAWFDFLFIQFYNTAQCSARAGISYLHGSGSNDITFHNWTLSQSLNPNIRYYIGLPADKPAAIDDSYYLTVDEAQQTVQRFYANENLLGGIMTWETTYSMNNVMCEKDYSTWMKDILLGAASGHPVNTNTTSCEDDTNQPPLTQSPDGSCGGTTGYTCSPGNCCSQYGYCGSTSDFCAAGCDLSAGICWATTTSSTMKSTTSTTSKASSTTSTVLKTTTTSKSTTTSTIKPTTSATTKKSTTTSTATVKTTSTTTKKSTTTSKATVKAAVVSPTTTAKTTSKSTTTTKVTTTAKPKTTLKTVTSTKKVTTTSKR